MTDIIDEEVTLLFPSLSFTSSNPINESERNILLEEIADHPISSSLYGKQGIHICHLNVRSILNKISQIRSLLKNNNIQFLAISESWCSEKISNNEIQVDNYNIVRQDRSFKANKKRKKNRRSGGLIIYVREDIAIDTKKFSHMNSNTIDNEALWISCKIPKVNEFIIGNFYRPPQGNKTNFINYLLDKVQPTIKNINKKEVFLIGDFNIDLKNKDNIGRMLLDTMKICNLSQKINVSTRLCGKKCTLLDHIYTNSCNIIGQGTGPLNISDHLLIYVTRKKVCNKQKKVFTEGRKLNNNKLPEFLDNVKNENWENFFNATTVNEAWNELESKLHKLADLSFPVKKRLRRKTNCEKWLSPQIEKEIVEKNVLLARAKKTENEVDIQAAHRKRNVVNRITERAKKNHYKNLLSQNFKDSKKVWKTLKEIIPSKKDVSGLNIENDEGVFLEGSDLANYINEFFNRVGATNACSPAPLYGPYPYPSLTFNPVDIDTISKLVKEIDIKKSSAIKNLPTLILKETFISNPNLLKHIINKCITDNDIPDKWKDSTIIPLKKVNNSTQVNDLRPISLLPLPSKILEKIIHKQCIEHLIRNNYFDPQQFGFQKDKSTISAVQNFTDDIFTAIENNHLTISTFIDFQKAFDRLNHSILLDKFKYFGFSDTAILFFKNYLKNRKQRTLINNTLSDPLTITHGICQGSILGPLTFLLYINDLGLSIKNCHYKLFADDTVIYCADKHINNSINNVNEDLFAIHDWCQRNNMAINVKKTKSMVFGRKNLTKKNQNVVLNLEGKNIFQTKLYKYLGVMLDENLNFNCHINLVLKNANHKLYLLRRVRKYLTNETAILLYKSYILPILEYGNTLYMSANSKHLDRLQFLQNSGLKSCFEASKRTNTNYLHINAKLNKLEDRRSVQLLKEMFKRSKDPKYLKQFRAGPVTRSMTTKTLNVPYFRNAQAQKSILFRGSNLWNNQPNIIKNINDQHIFNLKMKGLLKSKLENYVIY